jgi:ribosomal protein S8
MVKVNEASQWIETYKILMKAREALKEANEVRKTKQGHILVELKHKTSAIGVINNIRMVTKERLQLIPLQDKTSLEIRNIDPLISRKELRTELSKELKIKEEG